MKMCQPAERSQQTADPGLLWVAAIGLLGNGLSGWCQASAER